MNDILGKALLDYFQGNYTEDLITETNISEADVLPLPYLFRSFDEMPSLEQYALRQCFGKVLDVGCGAGSHSLYLQERGLEVMAIDRSPGAVTVAKGRGVKNTRVIEIDQVSEEKFDTILMLMNGTGIFETLENTPKMLKHLKQLLKNGGQLLIDSSDLQYMYDRNEDGSIWVPMDRYYGELEFSMSYKGSKTETFPWLYLHENLFEALAQENGYRYEVVARGEHFDYLAKLTV